MSRFFQIDCQATRTSASFLALITSLFLCMPTANAQSGNYRIEVLVFLHLNNTSAPVEVEQMKSYFEFADLQEVQQAAAPVRLDVQSSQMEDIWRKLRLSAGFQPLLFAAWEQSRIDYHPPVRIHDEEVLTEQAYFPYSRAQADFAADDSVTVFSDLVTPLTTDQDRIEPAEDYLAPYFRLDGTAQLTRTRFLHLRLDLEYREALISLPQQLTMEQDVAITSGTDPEQEVGATPGPAMVYTLRQSRPVSTGETQYFDSPFLGVIARVTATSGE